MSRRVKLEIQLEDDEVDYIKLDMGVTSGYNIGAARAVAIRDDSDGARSSGYSRLSGG
jgi:hypothetical protein